MRKNEVIRQNPLNLDEYWCTGCKQFLHKSLFSINRAKKHGLSNYCRKCCKIYVTRRANGEIVPRSKEMVPASEIVNRQNIKGFIKYFGDNKYLFKELFRKNFTDQMAAETFYEIKGIKVDCNDFISDNNRYAKNNSYRAPHL